MKIEPHLGPEAQQQDIELISRAEFALYLVLLALVLILTVRGGADYRHYYAWAEYFSSFDLDTLSSYPKSITGLPLLTWQYGTGLLAAIPSMIAQIHSPPPTSLVGAALSVANLTLIVCLVQANTNRTAATTAIACALLFFPFGFCLNHFASESWTIFFTLLSLLAIERSRRHSVVRLRDVTQLAASCYFLLLIKSANLLICASVILIFIADLYPRATRTRGHMGKFWLALSLLALLPGVELCLLSSYNYIVNGGLLANPYGFGDASYSAFSLKHLKIFEVMFSSWHGLLIYNPLVAAIGYRLLKSSRSCPVDAIALVAMLLQLFIQSCWFGWWMGGGTYGGRGFVGVTVTMAYAFLRNDGQHLGATFRSRSLLLCLCGLALFEIYLAGFGYSNFPTYSSFFEAMHTESARILLLWISFYVSFVGILCLLLYRDWRKSLTVLMSAMSLLSTGANPTQILTVIAGAALLAFAALSVRALHAGGLQISLVKARTPAFALGFFVVAGGLLITICAQIAMLRQFSDRAVRDFPNGHVIDCREIDGSLQEYQLLPGYLAEKQELKAFLERSGCIP